MSLRPPNVWFSVPAVKVSQPLSSVLFRYGTYWSRCRPPTGTASQNCQAPTGVTLSSMNRNSTQRHVPGPRWRLGGHDNPNGKSRPEDRL